MLAGFPCFAVAQNYAVTAIPLTCLPNANSVVRQAKTTFHVTAPDEAEEEELLAVTILNEKGKSMSQWVELEDQFTKVKRIQGLLYDAQGKQIRENDKSEVKDFGSGNDREYINAHQKQLRMESNQFPYTVVFKSKKVIKGFFRIDDFIVRRLGQSVANASFAFVNPESFPYDWKGVNTDVKPVITHDGKETVATWNFENLPALPQEPSNPYFDDEYAKLVFMPHRIKIDDYVGDFSNWKSIGYFMFSLNKDRDVLSAAMQKKILELTDGKTPREKIAVLYQFLQENNRYVSIQIGIGGWQTIEAGVVEQKKYGDCKALSNYMKAMLKVAGIEARLVAIYGGAGKAPEITDDVPIPYFNHMVLYVPAEKTWLECTSSNAPCGYMGYFTAGHHGLCLSADGGQLLAPPALTAADNAEVNRTDIRLDETGNVTVRNKGVLTGDLQEQYRSLVARKKQPEIEKYFIENAGFSIATLNALNINSVAGKPETLVSYQAEARNFIARSGKRLFVPMHKTNPFERSLPANEHRVLDLKLRQTYTQTDTIVIQLPAGYKVENLPAAKKISSDFGAFELSVSQEVGQVTAVFRIELQPVSVPAVRYNEVRQFYVDVAKADGAQMVLIKQE
jgi:hypothetical protein